MSEVVENTNIVHETEVQRQYARLNIPATVKIEGHSFKVEDLSTGGFCLRNTSISGEKNITEQRVYSGVLTFTVDGFGLSYDVDFKTMNQQSDGKLGCAFQNVNKRFTSAISYIFTAFLSGGLVSTGDLINTLSRENHTGARSKKELGSVSKIGHVKSILGSLIFLIIGVTAFSFVGLKLYGIYFVQNSTTAVVDISSHNLKMPKAARIESLLDNQSESVSKGQAIASYVSIDSAANASLQSKKSVVLTEQSSIRPKFTGTISSPCDCQAIRNEWINGQTLNKDDITFTLIESDAQAFVTAKFSFRDAEDLEDGQLVLVKLLGNAEFIEGRISKLYVVSSEKLVTARITTDEAINLKVNVWATAPIGSYG